MFLITQRLQLFNTELKNILVSCRAAVNYTDTLTKHVYLIGLTKHKYFIATARMRNIARRHACSMFDMKLYYCLCVSIIVSLLLCMYFVCLIQLLLPDQINHYYYYNRQCSTIKTRQINSCSMSYKPLWNETAAEECLV